MNPRESEQVGLTVGLIQLHFYLLWLFLLSFACIKFYLLVSLFFCDWSLFSFMRASSILLYSV